jgi:hypothetical protein
MDIDKLTEEEFAELGKFQIEEALDLLGARLNTLRIKMREDTEAYNRYRGNHDEFLLVKAQQSGLQSLLRSMKAH